MEETKPKKKGKKKVVLVNLRYTKYPLIRKCALEMGWKITTSKEENILFWCDNEGGSDLAASLKRYQFYNHFPGMSAIAHKVELSKNMDKMSRYLPDIYNFHPKTFIIPNSLRELHDFMLSIPKKSKRTFIVKPDTGCQGRGIKLIQDPKVLDDYDDYAVAQQYIDPFLVDGYKFDLRIYVLVTSISPLRIYILDEGMARFCTEPYQKPRSDNLGESYSHLTNFSLNKNSESFQANTTEIAPETGSKRTMTSVFKKIAESGGDVDKVKERIYQIIRLTLISIQPHLNLTYHTTVASNDGRSRCFEILGFDVLIDSSLRPWLIEVNTMPSLTTGSPFDEMLKKNAVLGAMKVINLKPSFKTKCIKQMKSYLYSKASVKPTCVYDPVEETEIAKTTHWQLIYPIEENEKNKELIEIAERAFNVANNNTSRETKASQKRKEMISKQMEDMNASALSSASEKKKKQRPKSERPSTAAPPAQITRRHSAKDVSEEVAKLVAKEPFTPRNFRYQRPAPARNIPQPPNTPLNQSMEFPSFPVSEPPQPIVHRERYDDPLIVQSTQLRVQVQPKPQSRQKNQQILQIQQIPVQLANPTIYKVNFAASENKTPRRIVSNQAPRAPLYHPKSLQNSKSPSFVTNERRIRPRRTVTDYPSVFLSNAFEKVHFRTEEEYERHKAIKMQQQAAEAAGIYPYIKMMMAQLAENSKKKEPISKNVINRANAFQSFVERAKKM